MLEELLQSDYEIQSIYAHKQWIEKNKEIISQKKITNLLFEASQEDLERITLLSTPNQVYSLVKMPKQNSEKTPKGLTIALDGIKDPGNLGTIIRLADWYAIENIICSPKFTCTFCPKTALKLCPLGSNNSTTFPCKEDTFPLITSPCENIFCKS